MPSGIPVLQVPEEDILARGTADPLADVAAQARFAEDLASILKPVPESAAAGDWAPVHGELLTFDNPETRLPAIDRLEGFRPGGSCLYRRVLVPVWATGAVFPAWLYTDGSRSMGNFRELRDGVWR